MRGLPLLPPPSLQRRATQTDTARRGQNSPFPPVTVTGRLQVRGASGNVGFVRNWSGGGTISGINFLSGSEPDLEVSITYNPSHPKQLNILATNPAFPAPFYVGASGGASSGAPSHLKRGIRSVLAFSNVAPTNPNAPPTVIPPYDSWVESGIWSYKPDTKELTAHWINADGTKVGALLAYDVRANALLFVSDINAYNAASTFPASQVKLYLV